MDKDMLKNFYFSNCSSFGAFKNASERRSHRPATSDGRITTTTASAPAAAATADASLSNVNVSMPSSIMDESQQQQQQAPVTLPAKETPGEEGKVAGHGFQAARTMASRTAQQKEPKGKDKKPQAPPIDAASAEYFEFLKKQQEMQKIHNRLEDVNTSMAASRRNYEGELLKIRRQAREMLTDIEQSSDWKLKSKYDTQQLIRDCNLALQPIELTEDRPPVSVGLAQIETTLVKLKKEHDGTDQFTAYNLFVDQALRRLSLLEKALADGNNDTTNVSRIADTLLIHLENICAVATLESRVHKFEDEIDVSQFKIEEARQQRESAISEGEVHIAEKLCYDVITQHEEIIAQVVSKAKVVDQAIQENAVLEEVREQYASKTVDEFEKIRARSRKLKKLCEEDLKKMFALREKVEEVEAQTAVKIEEDRRKSDKVLAENATKIEKLFMHIDELEKEVEVLERERHREIQKRLTEKDKDEHRRAEFARFCAVLEDHTVPLERSIKNMDLMVHAADVVQEFVNEGFSTMKGDLETRQRLLKDVKLEAHKQHTEVLRGLMLELGEMIYKKERMVEETDKNIQQAHIQQELLAETFNPNAKRFGDVKKKLLLNRDELEEDIKELKQRADTAVSGFGVSEEALEQNKVSFIHPVTEQEHHRLAMRSRMIEFKAAAVGHISGNALLKDVETFKREIQDTHTSIEEINTDTSGTMNKTLPMIRAAAKSRRM